MLVCDFFFVETIAASDASAATSLLVFGFFFFVETIAASDAVGATSLLVFGFFFFVETIAALDLEVQSVQHHC